MASRSECKLLYSTGDERIKVDQGQYNDDYPHIFQGRLHAVDFFVAGGQLFNDLCNIFFDFQANINKND